MVLAMQSQHCTREHWKLCPDVGPRFFPLQVLADAWQWHATEFALHTPLHTLEDASCRLQ